MEESILKSTKKILGLNPDDTSFDLDIITHINTVFSILRDLGVGQPEGFTIVDDTKKWSDFTMGEDLTVDMVKSYVYARVRLVFDPPQQVFLAEALNQQAKEFETRISINRENRDWVNPNPPEPVIPTGDQYE